MGNIEILGNIYLKGDKSPKKFSINVDKILFSEQKNRIGTSKRIYLNILIISSTWKKEKHSSIEIVWSNLIYASFTLKRGKCILLLNPISSFSFLIAENDGVNKASDDFDFCLDFAFATSLLIKSIPWNLKDKFIWVLIVKGIGICKTICSINFSIGKTLLSFTLMT